MKKIYAAVLLTSITLSAQAQGTISGDLMMNLNFFNRDSTINAANNPLYDNFLSGGESWLTVRYQNKDFSAFIRADAFHNSNLYNPTSELSGYGIGAWGVSKEFGNLHIQGGYIYDQIGSGILFRSYEDRGLLIDNALVGLKLGYKLNDNIRIKGYTGQQKFLFQKYQPVIKALNIEGEFSLGDNVSIQPGIGGLNRTLDRASMDDVVASINAQPDSTKFTPRYNTYAATVYNTLNAGDFTWYVEGAYKTHEAILANDALIDKGGTVIFSTLGYARKGLAVNLLAKRTENFMMRTSPNEVLLRGMMNWQPVIARTRPQRTIARYTPASQDLSEKALGADVLISPNENLDIVLNHTRINNLDTVKLYRELYGEAIYRGFKDVTLKLGAQYLEYNQEKYQIKPGVPMVKAFTVFGEGIYKINKKHSIRAQVEYQDTKQDFGSWFFALLEYSIAPNWSFAISDMITVKLNPNNPVGMKDPKHFYNLFVAYKTGAHRFTAQYVKQVEGINCTGGVCRYEPAFSGFKMSVTTSF